MNTRAPRSPLCGLSQESHALAQYYELRNPFYRRYYPHPPDDFDHEEATDHVSDIVAAYDGRVVAGGRITVSRPW